MHVKTTVIAIFFITFAGFNSVQKYIIFNSMSGPRCFVFCFVVLAAFGCAEPRFDADITSVDYEARFIRLDREVFALDTDHPLPRYNALTEEHRSIFGDYVEDIMRVGSVENPMTASLLMRFTSAPEWRGLQEHVESVFPDLKPFEAELGRALKRYAVLFGKNELPELAAYNSGFNVGIYPSDDWLGVGLEWYAGSDHKYVKQLPPDLFPQYKRDKMQPEYLVPNALRGWVLYTFRDLADEENLLAEMVFAGKAAYITAALLELTDAQRVLNYTEAQKDWCRKNEYDIWKSLVERDLIFIDDPMEINKMMNDGPFTPGMPPESPGGVGKWVGYRMVKQYVDKNPDLSLPALMAEKDYRKILKAYKPGR